MSGSKGINRQQMADLIARQFQDGWIVNLGVGIPTMCSNTDIGDTDIVYHSENGVIGYGAVAAEGQEDLNLVNAGGQNVTLKPGSAIVHHADSFAIIRGGHIDVTVMGAYQVSSRGDFANWKLKGQKGGGIGGAMDLAACAKRVFIILEHTTRDGSSRLVPECDLPVTARGVVKLIATNYGLFEPTGDGFLLKEIAPGVTVDDIRAATGANLTVADPLPVVRLEGVTGGTVFALASGAGRAAIAVLRISGPGSADVLTALCGSLPLPRRAVVRALRDTDGGLLDLAMVLWLPGPKLDTVKDSAELHLHAGRAVIDAVADTLISRGLRPAEPGEFTRRAFLNGKLDLVSAEAVHDLVAAETDAQRRQALRQLDGALGALYRDWSDRLRGALARQEALIDFPEEDLPPEVEADLIKSVRTLRGEIDAHLDDNHRGEKLREGLFFAITGAPNVGKSSLINALAERDVAIVSATPGTTRDAIETRVILGGVPVTLVDTAGIRDTVDPIEIEGVRRARARATAADLVITVIESGRPFDPARGGLVVANKSDLAPEQRPEVLPVSALTGAGLPELRARLSAEATALTQSSGPPPLTRARHRTGLLAAARWLGDAEDAIEPELRGEAMRLALRALGTITGQVGVEDILDSIFLQFCIGK